MISDDIALKSVKEPKFVVGGISFPFDDTPRGGKVFIVSTMTSGITIWSAMLTSWLINLGIEYHREDLFGNYDVIKLISQKSVPYIICISVLSWFFVNYMYNFFMKSNRPFAIMVYSTYLLVGMTFTYVEFMNFGMFCIPVVFNDLVRQGLVFLGVGLNVIISVILIKWRYNTFLGKREHPKVWDIWKKIQKPILAVLPVAAAISFVTASATSDLRRAFYGAISPFLLIVTLPVSLYIYYYEFGLFLRNYCLFKYSEQFREVARLSPEKWYGEKYKESKTVMKQINEYKCK